MKTIEEQYLLNKIEEASKKKVEYLEVDRNKEASKWENKEILLVSIYSLIEDGYKWRTKDNKYGK